MYLDTSVLVKLYVREPDSSAVERTVSGERILCSELVYAEFWSALLAKERAGVLSADMRQRVWQLFEIHLLDDQIELVEVDGLVVRDAAEMMARVFPRVPLRTLDALHLATYAAIDAGPLFTKDQRMIDAARLLGLPLAE
ncbi:MAG: type II toxin-antitoxin system VapC family toxin [Opitutaceae bacterium]|nr:type II toxin-antitoxin system VapC family toxin [Opitutaceae bacterium]